MKTLLLLVLVATAAKARTTGKADVWGYGNNNGPNTWPETYPTCGGARQSPVALDPEEAIQDSALGPFTFENYDSCPLTAMLTNTGHAVEVDLSIKASVTGGNLTDKYTFHQFHFHWGAADNRGSEHTLDDNRFPAELHMVHYKESYNSWDEALKHDDGVAVLAILLEMSHTDNTNLQPIINGLADIIAPQENTIITPITLRNVLPDDVDCFYRYQGSLTTPGCNEVVVWTVFKDTITISSGQLDQFRQLIAADGSILQDNFRTLQPLNSRKVYQS